MKLIVSPSSDSHFNLALEQYVFDVLDKNEEYFMLWQNDNTIVVGIHQNTNDEIKHDVVKEKGIKVVRRLSGGGAVYHDMGNLNFTYITDKKTDKGAIDFTIFTKPVAKALSKLGVDAQVNGRNDITIDGKKFSGNAQYVKKGRIMHHGTLLFDSNLGVVGACLNVSKEKMASKGVKSVASRVTNIKDYMDKDITMEQFKEALLSSMFEQEEIEKYELTDADVAAVEVLKSKRYSLDEWNYGKSPKYNQKRKMRFEGVGTVEAYLEVKKPEEIIKNITFHGDFFSSLGIKEFEEILADCSFTEEGLTQRLEGLDISDYITGMSNDQMLELFFTPEGEINN